jgi:NAD(P)-dependent dehydrogenase (short-subunit alcohol dehydrogenase family)
MRFLITGISRGIGRAVAGQLLDDGHEAFGIARPGAEVPAGVVRGGTLEETAATAFTTQLAVNVTAAAMVTTAFLPALRATGGTVVRGDTLARVIVNTLLLPDDPVITDLVLHPTGGGSR